MTDPTVECFLCPGHPPAPRNSGEIKPGSKERTEVPSSWGTRIQVRRVRSCLWAVRWGQWSAGTREGLSLLHSQPCGHRAGACPQEPELGVQGPEGSEREKCREHFRFGLARTPDSLSPPVSGSRIHRRDHTHPEAGMALGIDFPWGRTPHTARSLMGHVTPQACL